MWFSLTSIRAIETLSAKISARATAPGIIISRFSYHDHNSNHFDIQYFMYHHEWYRAPLRLENIPALHEYNLPHYQILTSPTLHRDHSQHTELPLHFSEILPHILNILQTTEYPLLNIPILVRAEIIPHILNIPQNY